MANQSPHPNSLSPRSKQATSAFQWPIPSPPSQPKANTLGQPNNLNDISVKEILDRYSDDSELLKYILTAKSEEDKKKAARDTLKAEEARIQLRQMDLDIAREHSKASIRYDRSHAYIGHIYPHHYITPQSQPYSAHPHLFPQNQQPPKNGHDSHNPPQAPQLQHPATQPHKQPQSAHPSIPRTHPQHPPNQSQTKQQQQQQQHVQQPHQASTSYPYYGLAPVQQQVLARFNYPAPYGPPGHYSQPPPSPSVPYPHSAHPLCPPTTANTMNKKKSSEDKSSNNGYHPQPKYSQQQSPISPITASALEENNTSSTNNTLKKRSRSSFSAASNEHAEQPQQDKLSHNKVMEALKAKIQRGNSGPNSSNGIAAPTGTSATTTFTTSSVRSTTQTEHQQSNNSNGTSNKRRKPTLQKPTVSVQEQQSKSKLIASPSPSPRSAKPVLPPIDTNLGRADAASTKLPNHPLSQQQSSSSSNSSHSATVSSLTGTNGANEAVRSIKVEEHSDSHTSDAQLSKESTAVITENSSDASKRDELRHLSTDKQADTQTDTVDKRNKNLSKPTTTVSSPSDHVILNTRRARSLSPSPSATATSAQE